MALLLFAIGYPASIAVIVRWVPVVREQRWRWFWIHQAAVAAIVAGHALRDSAGGVIVNGTWFVAAAVWFLAAGARQRRAA
ncbi:MAG: hypothetical protein ACSLFP_06765 [Acidimicrobiales bacterium]